MYKYDELLAKWRSIIDKAKIFDDSAFMEIGEKASADEIAKVEAELGITLPPSFGDALLNVGKSFDFYYFLNGYVLPDELGDIFSGVLTWDIAELRSADEIAWDDEEDDAETNADAKKVKTLYPFSHAGNGDLYVFDMAGDAPEKPVLYWDHETCELTYVADSFWLYLEKITELYCVGNEIWQIEAFIDEKGLNADTEKAQSWKKWFESFTTTTLADVTDDFDKLFQFAICRENMDEQIITALMPYGKAPLFEKLKETMKEGAKRQEVSCKMMALLIGDYAQDWLVRLWDHFKVSGAKYSDSLEFEDMRMSARLLSYLSASCMDKTVGAERVIRFVETQYANSTDLDMHAFHHLKHFDAEQVIPWIEEHLGARPDWWGQLLIEGKPEWATLLRWSKGDKKYQSALVEGLHYFVRKPECRYQIAEFPPQEEFQLFLNELKEGQMLSTKKRKIDEVIAKMDCFY